MLFLAQVEKGPWPLAKSNSFLSKWGWSSLTKSVHCVTEGLSEMEATIPLASSERVP